MNTDDTGLFGVQLLGVPVAHDDELRDGVEAAILDVAITQFLADALAPARSSRA